MGNIKEPAQEQTEHVCFTDSDHAMTFVVSDGGTCVTGTAFEIDAVCARVIHDRDSAVIVIDPKSDRGLRKRLQLECERAGRPESFRCFLILLLSAIADAADADVSTARVIYGTTQSGMNRLAEYISTSKPRGITTPRVTKIQQYGKTHEYRSRTTAYRQRVEIDHFMP